MLLGVLTGLLSLVGCAQAPKSLYNWGGYQAQVYQHFKGDDTSPLEQFAALDKHRQEVLKAGLALPPGYLAHMGLLQYKLGQAQAAQQLLQAEKANFPESGRYIDELIAKLARTER